jgi:hypothetical protein
MKSVLPKILALLFLSTPLVFSQNDPGPEGVRQHDGFFLRLVPGGGSSRFFMTAPDDKLQQQYKGKDVLSLSDGFTAANSIQIGGAVAENLIIYGESGGVLMASPTVKAYEEELSNPGSVWVYFGGVGPGITYYFMPANVYISGTILANVAVMSVQGSAEGSKIGLGCHFIAGKEWWAGEQWGLGVAAYFRYGTQENDDVDWLTMSGTSFGLLFSATFN